MSGSEYGLNGVMLGVCLLTGLGTGLPPMARWGSEASVLGVANVLVQVFEGRRPPCAHSVSAFRPNLRSGGEAEAEAEGKEE